MVTTFFGNSAPKQCPVCSKRNEATANYCDHCGHKFQEQTSASGLGAVSSQIPDDANGNLPEASQSKSTEASEGTDQNRGPPWPNGNSIDEQMETDENGHELSRSGRADDGFEKVNHPSENDDKSVGAESSFDIIDEDMTYIDGTETGSGERAENHKKPHISGNFGGQGDASTTIPKIPSGQSSRVDGEKSPSDGKQQKSGVEENADDLESVSARKQKKTYQALNETVSSKTTPEKPNPFAQLANGIRESNVQPVETVTQAQNSVGNPIPVHLYPQNSRGETGAPAPDENSLGNGISNNQTGACADSGSEKHNRRHSTEFNAPSVGPQTYAAAASKREKSSRQSKPPGYQKEPFKLFDQGILQQRFINLTGGYERQGREEVLALVEFSVMLPADVPFNNEEDAMCMAFSCFNWEYCPINYCGEIPVTATEKKTKNELVVSYRLFGIRVHIPLSILRHSRSLLYKYCILRKNGFVIWEERYEQTSSTSDRILRVGNFNGDVYCAYGGCFECAEVQPSSYFQKVKGFAKSAVGLVVGSSTEPKFKRLQLNLGLVMGRMLPKFTASEGFFSRFDIECREVKEKQLSLAQTFQQIMDTFRCFSKFFFRCKYTADLDAPRKVLKDYLVGILNRCRARLGDHPLTARSARIDAGAALVCIHVMHFLGDREVSAMFDHQEKLDYLGGLMKLMCSIHQIGEDLQPFLEELAALDISILPHSFGEKCSVVITLNNAVKQLNSASHVVFCIPLFHLLIRNMGNVESLSNRTNVLDEQWWKVPRCHPYFSRSVSGQFDQQFFEAHWNDLLPCQSWDIWFSRSVLYLFCWVPGDVLNLQIGRQDPISTLAWIYLRYSRKQLTSKTVKDVDDLKSLIEQVCFELIQLGKSAIKYTEEETMEMVQVFSVFVSVSANLVDETSSVLPQELFHIILKTFDAFVILVGKHGRLQKDFPSEEDKSAFYKMNLAFLEHPTIKKAKTEPETFLKLWTFLINQKHQFYSLLKEIWAIQIKEMFEESIRRLDPKSVLEVIGHEEYFGFEFKELMEKYATAAIENLLSNRQLGEYLDSARQSLNSGVQKCFSEIFKKVWAENVGKEADLNAADEQKVMEFFLKSALVYPLLTRQEVLDGTCQTLMATGISIVQSAVSKCEKMEANLGTVKLINRNEAAVLRLMVEIGPQNDENQAIKDHISQVLAKMKDISHEYHFLQCCGQLLAEYFSGGDEACAEMAELKKVTCCSWEDVKIFNIVTSLGNQCEKPTYRDFGISEKVRVANSKLTHLKKSTIFWNAWKNHLNHSALRQESSTIEQLVCGVLESVSNEVKNLVRNIHSGTISLQKLERWLRRLPDDFVDEHLESELSLLRECFELNLSVAIPQVKLIHKFKSLRSIDEVTMLLQKLLRKLNLNKCRKEVKKISCLAQMDDSMRLSDVTDELINSAAKLNGIVGNNQRISCLQKLLECWDLIEWTKSEAGKDQKELHSFVDIATTNVGESDEEIAMVMNFGKAVTGYAPLIYFDSAANDNLDRFLGSLEIVWTSLESDQNLSEKLVESKKNKTRIEALHNATGKLEKSSIQKVESINSDGQFRVGMNHIKSNQPSIESCLWLEIQNPSVEESLNMSEIRDLHSRLMLIGGQMESSQQTKINIDKFSDLFESVQTIGSLVINHCKAGNVLFSEFECTISCNETSMLHMLVQLHSNAVHLSGSDGKDLKAEIEEVIDFLVESLDAWNIYIKHLREEFPELNYFSNQQLVQLRRCLAKITKGVPEPKDLMLFMKLIPDVSAQVLKDALSKYNTEAETAEVHSSCKTDEQELQAFIESLMEMGLSKDDALKSAAACGTSCTEAAMIWHFDQQRKSNKLPQDPSPSFAEKLSEISKLYDSQNEHSIGLKLKNIWNSYLEAQEQTKFQEFSGLKQLGKILRLATKDTPALDEIKSSYTWLKNSEPNLIVVQESEMLRHAISLFVDAGLQGLRSDTVMVCSEKTSSEDLKLFIQRIRLPLPHLEKCKLYCLIGIDQLRNDVCQQVEQEIDNLMAMNSSSSVLVLYCSKEHYEHSHLAGVYARYQRHGKMCLSVLEAKTHVEALLQQNSHESVNLTTVKPEYLLEKYYGVFVTSVGYGHGKSSAIRCFKSPSFSVVKIPLHLRHLDFGNVFKCFRNHVATTELGEKRLIHIDILDHRTTGVDKFLFQLLILGGFEDSSGNVWRRLPSDLYAVEMTSMPSELLLVKSASIDDVEDQNAFSSEFRFLLPLMQCHSPQITLGLLKKELKSNGNVLSRLVDPSIYEISAGRCFEFLRRQGALGNFVFKMGNWRGKEPEIISVLLRNCGVKNPSWLELAGFVHFLNAQLLDYENSCFCNPAFAEDLPGFQDFVVRFMIQMSKDFATRSLKISENIGSLDRDSDQFDQLRQYELKRKWEGKPHPYLFFNADRSTFSFFGCHLRSSAPSSRGLDVPFDLVDSTGRKILCNGITTFALVHALETQGVKDIRASGATVPTFESKSEGEKLVMLCRVLGIEENTSNPDPSYQITTDCALKMLAIEMRFRAGIPVVIMGETGCGKTRLIRFLCDLKKGERMKNVNNLVIVRLHGGITEDNIKHDVSQALKLAKKNRESHGIQTCLFFDEANTTGAVSLIKEIMCDRTMGGEPVDLSDLNIVAAVNPYRRHSDEMIKNLESAGLGYHVKESDKLETFGDVPLRQLVYRVQPLPPSLIPLVWDFGNLTSDVQRIYIQQMVSKMVTQSGMNFGSVSQKGIEHSIVHVVSSAQQYMSEKTNEASFVSLRDVERVLMVMQWMYDHADPLFEEMRGKLSNAEEEPEIDDITRSLVLALCVCYRASLQIGRDNFDEFVAQTFSLALQLPNGPETIRTEISACQDVFLDHVRLEENIARNEALKENVFMMAICIELRIPLFLVGKPGSSKSLAKTIVDAAMRGRSSTEDGLFKELKQAKLVSYQCSPLATADGVEAIFRQCARDQKGMPLDNFVAVAVFDEVGLAEDSPKLPLKALHGLLEEGCAIENPPETIQKGDYHHVSFVGISNWALDPAKMNRGIFVSRVLPSKEELMTTAKRICCEDSSPLYPFVQSLLGPLIEAYLAVYETHRSSNYEFFGLRDFYSLIKMVFDLTAKHRRKPELDELMYAVCRNFGGLKDGAGSCQNEFMQRFLKIYSDEPNPDVVRISELIEDNLNGEPNKQRDNRFLLILTENYAAMRMLQKISSLDTALPIFGSSFPLDLEYTQICRNINKIKICMDTGKTVILLNLETLYESLYDLLNQAFSFYAKERYVDMGLGSHRLKCHVHKDFRVIVIAEAEEVRRCFPAALINRLEKYYVSMQTDLSREQKSVSRTILRWAEKTFANLGALNFHESKFTAEDVLIGFHSDTAASIVLEVWKEDLSQDQITENARRMLLQSATPESVVRFCESLKVDRQEAEWVSKVYFEEQKHSDLGKFLRFWITSPTSRKLVQITTHASQLLSRNEAAFLGELEQFPPNGVHVMTLQQYGTEQQFGREARRIFVNGRESRQLVFVQCMAAEQNSKLVACVRYKLQEYVKEYPNSDTRVVFLVCLQRLPMSLKDSLHRWIEEGADNVTRMTTHHKLTTEEGTLSLWTSVGFKKENVHIVLDREREFESTMDRAMSRGEDEKQLVVVQFLAGERRQPVKLAGDCRSTTIRLIKNHPKKTDVRVLLLISLPRISSFPGEQWDSYHLDDLCAKEGDLIDIGRLQHLSISDVLCDQNLINSQILIRDCVHQAGSIISDQTERKLERAKLFLDVLENNEIFAGEVMRWVVRLLIEMENNMTGDLKTAWVVREAGNMRRVLESETFRQALRKKIEEFVIPLVAIILCYVDVGHNLNNLQDSNALWMPLFADETFLNDLTYEKQMFVKGKDGVRKALQTFAASAGSSAKYMLNFPFSWIIKKKMDEMLSSAQESLGPHFGVEDVQSRYCDSQWSNTLEDIFPGQQAKLNAFKSYLQDFVCLNYSPTSDTEARHFMEWIGTNATDLEHNLKLWLPLIHVTNAQLELQIRIYQNFASSFPEMAEDVFADNQMKSRLNFELDLCIAKKCIDGLMSDVENKRVDHSLGEQTEAQRKLVIKRRTEWMRRYNRLLPLVQQLFGADFRQINESRARKRTHHFNELKRQWDVLTVCFGFLSHVTGVSHQYNLNPIFKLLAADANVRSAKFLESIQARLSMLNAVAFSSFFKGRGMPVCARCERPVKKPELLPCMHILHQKCFEEMQVVGSLDRCPKCGENFEEDLQATADEKLKKTTDEYLKCRSALTRFFLDLVTTFVFAGTEPPSAEVVQCLLGYITVKKETETGTMDFSLFPDEDTIDRSPVVRSFLLQQLLQFEIPTVSEQIQQYIHDSSQHLRNETERMDFNLMIIACIEDSLHSKYSACKTTSDKLNFLITRTNGVTAVKEGTGAIFDVENVAKIRFMMAAISDLLAEWFGTKVNIFGLPKAFSILRKLQECLESSPNAVSLYLLKYFCRRHGLETFKAMLAEYYQLRWILPGEFNLDDQSPDSFVLYGPEYRTVRDAILAYLLHENDTNKTRVEESLVMLPQDRLELILCLATESALSYFKENQPSLTGLNALLMSNMRNGSMSTIALDFGRTFPVEALRLTGSDAATQLLISVRTALGSIAGADLQTIPGLFSVLLSAPEQLRDDYLPVMPEDMLSERLRDLTEGQSLTLNYCPNNHPYFIGNCGRPVVQLTCIDCGAVIGGTSHVFASGNWKANVHVDQTLRGHCLGPSNSGLETSVRELTPTETSLLRALLHTGLCASAIIQPQEAARLVTKGNGSFQFFWDHLNADLERLQRLLNRSKEDVLHLIGECFRRLVTSQSPPVPALTSKTNRVTWENCAAKWILKPVIELADTILNDVHHAITDDEGRNPILRVIYELNMDDDYSWSQFWRYREPNTEESLMRALRSQIEISDGENERKFLKEFASGLPNLKPLVYLPVVLSLQRKLYAHFKGVFDLLDKTTIHQFLETVDSEMERKLLRNLIEGFFAALQRMLPVLKQMAFPGSLPDSPMLRLNDDNLPDLRNIWDNPLLTILPLPSREGLCSCILVHALISANNNFVDAAFGNSGGESIEEVEAEEIGTSVQSVGFDFDADILPSLWLNRSFAFSVRSRETEIKFVLYGLERSLRQSVFSRPVRIRPKIRLFRTRRDIINECRQKLQNKVPQSNLTNQKMQEVVTSMRESVARTKRCLDTAELLLRYLSSVETLNSDQTLKDALVEKLRIQGADQIFGSYKIAQLVALWEMLLFTHAYLLTVQNGGSYFMELRKDSQESLLPQDAASIKKLLTGVDLPYFLTKITSFIFLHLPSLDSDSNSGERSSHILNQYLWEFSGCEEAEMMELPDSVLLKHSVAVWNLATEKFREIAHSF